MSAEGVGRRARRRFMRIVAPLDTSIWLDQVMLLLLLSRTEEAEEKLQEHERSNPGLEGLEAYRRLLERIRRDVSDRRDSRY